jgi:hypothetical protein
LRAGGEADALAALNRHVGGAKATDPNNPIADMIGKHASGLTDPAHRAAAVAILQRLLAVENPDTQLRACRALANYGADAKPALPALKALTSHDNATLKQAAEQAVGKIGG